MGLACPEQQTQKMIQQLCYPKTGLLASKYAPIYASAILVSMFLFFYASVLMRFVFSLKHAIVHTIYGISGLRTAVETRCCLLYMNRAFAAELIDWHKYLRISTIDSVHIISIDQVLVAI